MRLPALGGLLAATTLALAVPAVCLAQAAQPQALSPAEDALAQGFLAAVNGDATAREAFLAKWVAAKPRMPREEFPKLLQAVHDKSGGLKLVSATRRADFVRLMVQAQNGRTARLDLHAPADAGGKLMGIMTIPFPAPYPEPLLNAPVSRDELAKAIERRVRFSAARDDFSGAVLVMKDGQVLYSGTFGEADKAAHRPITLDTRFNLGSMDKQFTAVAVGQLIEQGKLSLDTRLIDVLPDYPNPEAAKKITIRHLLSHSAGLGMLFERPGWNWKLKYRTMGELLPLFAKEPLEFEPGSRGAYANEGFVVLGAVLEKVTGQSWYDYVQHNVFDRAGMSHSGYLTDDPSTPDRATGYKFADDDPLGSGARQPNWDTLSWRGNSCGGGYSTVGDMVKFLTALRSGKLLKSETAALFTADAGIYRDYGLGFQHIAVKPGRAIVGHDGGGPGSGINSDAKMVWETGYIYAVLGNYDAPFAQNLGGDIGKMLAAQD